MSSPLGLDKEMERYNTRQRAKRAAMLGYHNRDRINYTQGAARWEGIAHKDHASKGQYPRNADCSAYVSWCLWDSTRIYDLFDFANGASWTGGFTGTLTNHGVRVTSGWLLVGDLVFYGGTSSVPEHVAIVVSGGPISKARVVSHGSQRGPLLLAANYRTINQCRRYIR